MQAWIQNRSAYTRLLFVQSNTKPSDGHSQNVAKKSKELVCAATSLTH